MPVLRVWHKLLRRLQLLDGDVRGKSKHRRLGLETLEDRAVPATLFVATSGSDADGNGTDPSKPFLSIQKAVSTAKTGDVVKVAAGTYGFNAALDVARQNFGTTGVVAVFDKQITLLGGFTTSNFNTANPTANKTIIDGGGQVRGVYINNNQLPTSLDIQGFTIQNGLAGPNTLRGGLDAIFGFGGGMYIDNLSKQTSADPNVIKNVVFQNNTAQGSNTTSNFGGAGGGGGLAVFAGTNLTMDNVSFIGNKALGGSGPVRGGGALGGAFFATVNAKATGTNLTFTNNTATAGNSSGGGVDSDNEAADALGGAIAVQNGSDITFTSLTVGGNTAIGGNAGTAAGNLAGNSFGGGVFVELARLTLTDATITSNTAQGGVAFKGGIGGGGGVQTANADLIINRSSIINNTAVSGNGAGGSVGDTGGGGLYLTRFAVGTFGNVTTITNSVIAGNVARLGSSGTTNTAGGGGGAFYINGLPVTISHSTIADNSIQSGLQLGVGVLTLAGGQGTPTTLNLDHSIIANHSSTNGGAALNVRTGSTVNINRLLFANNTKDSNANGLPEAAGTINGINTIINAAQAGFISSGAPNFNYGIIATSAARDAATGSTITVDRTNSSRVGTPDLGAFEFRPPTVAFKNLDNQAFDTQTTVTVTVSLSSPTDTTVTVNYATSDSTARAGTDYVATSGTLTFNPGESEKTFSIQLIPNRNQTGNLRLNLTLSSPAGVGLGFLSKAVATIQDTEPSDNLLFISGLYNDLLNRPSSFGDRNFFLDPLLAAETPRLPGVLARFVSSPGYFAQLAGDRQNGYYAKYLGRTAQPAEADFWGLRQAVDGQTTVQVISQFIGSDEYFSKKGNNDKLTWLKAAFKDVIGRDIDANGQSFYLPQVGDGIPGRTGVVTQLLASDEYRLGRIDTFFQVYLNRGTNEIDRQFWLNQFKAGQVEEQIIVGIGGSLEGLLSNGGTNAKWITTLYQKLLAGRSPRPDELAFHLGKLQDDENAPLDNGYKRQRFNTAQAILSSGEFASSGTFSLTGDVASVIRGVFTRALGREAGAGDISFWSTQFNGDKVSIAAAILASSDYFNRTHKFP